MATEAAQTPPAEEGGATAAAMAELFPDGKGAATLNAMAAAAAEALGDVNVADLAAAAAQAPPAAPAPAGKKGIVEGEDEDMPEEAAQHEEDKKKANSLGAPEQQRQRAYSSLIDQKEAQRIQKLALAVSERAAPPWAAQYLQQIAPVIGFAGATAEVVGPAVFKFYSALYKYYSMMPHNAANLVWGLGICFYGGQYPLTLAAIEAWRIAGGDEMASALRTIKENFVALQKANEEEEAARSEEEANEEDGKALLARKTHLLLRVIQPEELSDAVGAFWSGYLGILASLKLKFARTTALAHSLGDGIRPAARKILGPTLLAITPTEHQKWVSPALNATCKIIGLTVAWKLTRGLSMAQSGLKGGLMASSAMLMMLKDSGMIKIKPEETRADEVIGASLAACGIYYQMFLGGVAPLLLLPATMPLGVMETTLQWSVAFLGKTENT